MHLSKVQYDNNARSDARTLADRQTDDQRSSLQLHVSHTVHDDTSGVPRTWTGDDKLSAVPWDVVVAANAQRVQQSRLAVKAAADDECDSRP